MQSFSVLAQAIAPRMTWLAGLAVLLMAATSSAQAPQQWIAGKHYFLVNGPQQVSVAPGKIEVTEVFSYGCSACNFFYPLMERIKASLPSNAEVTYLHASFNAAEQWPMFQRAFITAQVLKVADQSHKAMFDSIWKGGELALRDGKGVPKKPAPTIETAAGFYKRVAGVDSAKFLSVAKGFAVEGKVRRAEKLIRDYGADSTPTMVVNGRYRLTATSAGGEQELIELINWLVAKESMQRSANAGR
jgi:protein dithiol oxidoreductase (disulfide-forming)